MMELSKAAAATAAVVPFHCVICFDSFHLQDRLPVVLPCGHTFVCQPCSKRLKRCMECREPLFYTIPKNSQATGTNGSSSSSRGRYSPTPSTPPQPVRGPDTTGTRVFYPIPKNFVLISMMEVAEHQAKEMKALLDETNGSMEAEDDEEEYDLNRIISGMATYSGPCGTYAVKEAHGLALLSQDTDWDCHHNEYDIISSTNISHEEVLDQRNEGTAPLAVAASEDSIEVKHNSLLERGQTVQVVSFENNVAKLARGAGYIIADSSQLVKVGGPLDVACRLEGLLDTVINRGDDLQKELDENKNIEESLRRELEAEFRKEPNYPIITNAPQQQESLIVPADEKHESRDPATPPNPRNGTSDTYNDSSQTPGAASPDSAELLIKNLRIGVSGLANLGRTATFPFGPNSIDQDDMSNSGLPAYRRNASHDDSEFYGCGAASFLGGQVRLFADPQQPPSPIRLIDENENRRRSESADGGHPCLAPSLTSSFDTVDFRTGLSGHRGLNNAASKNKPMVVQHYSPTPRTNRMMLMSEHRGIARVRGPLNRSSTTNNTPPSPP